jgi:5-methylcytosine-specific restriction endonuclease McrBC GTP-binding regulatory subunit McrB
MENRFEATSLGRALVQFNESPYKPGDLKEQMLLVLLDEMNLARIEYYFSEFLSKLEMRRNSTLGREEDYRNVSVEVFAGYPGDEECDPSDPVRLYAGSNVLFVGTMNEDETTQSLSDKVIDRANVLYFGRPNRLSERRQRTVPTRDWLPMGATTWRQWIKEAAPGTIPGYAQIDDLVNRINGTLAQLGRPFGWRTYKAIMAYVANHPDVRFGTDPGLRPLADQVAMRVMPKLRGVDLVEHGDVFNALGQLIQQVNDRPLRDAFDRARQSTQGFFDWRGISWEG